MFYLLNEDIRLSIQLPLNFNPWATRNKRQNNMPPLCIYHAIIVIAVVSKKKLSDENNKNVDGLFYHVCNNTSLEVSSGRLLTNFAEF